MDIQSDQKELSSIKHNSLDIIITKGYINTYEHFLSKLKEQYGILDVIKEVPGIISIVLIKNYLSAVELNRMLLGFSYTLSTIQKINLTANNLEGMPPGFDSLVGIKILILNNNKIKKIEHLGSMTQIERLELRGNQIERIEGINNLIHLKVLTLSTNLIKAIDDADIPPLNELNEFGLFGNYLGCETDDHLNRKLFNDTCAIIANKLINLKSIYLGGNMFSSLDNCEKIAKEIIKTLLKYDGHNINSE